MKKNLGGRPKLPRGKAKGQIIVVRFLDSEWRQIERAARLARKRLSAWMFDTLLAAAAKVQSR